MSSTSLKSFVPALTLAVLTACSPSKEEQRIHQNMVNDVRREFYKKGLDTCYDDMFSMVKSKDIGTREFSSNSKSASLYSTSPRGYAEYYASSSPLHRAEDQYGWDPRAQYNISDSYINFNGQYRYKPRSVSGLPPSLGGKEVHINSIMFLRNYPYAIHLGADDSEIDKDYYLVTSGTTTLKNGLKADKINIVGPMDYCVSNEVDYRSCWERFGEITVTIKPASFDSTCADLKVQFEQAIKKIQ